MLKLQWYGPLTTSCIRPSRILARFFAVATGLAATVLLAHPTPEFIPPPPVLALLLHVTIGFSFIIVGLIASFRRPQNRVGVLMSTVGAAWFLLDLCRLGSALPFTIAFNSTTFYQAILAHLFIVFPTGRAQTRLNRILISLMYGWYLLSSLAGGFFWDSQRDHCFMGGCPRNLLLIHRDFSLNVLVGQIVNFGNLLTIVAVLVVVIGRWKVSTASMRRVLEPIVWASVPITALLVSLDLVSTTAPWSNNMLPPHAMWWIRIGQLALTALPVTFLIGLLRTHLDHFSVNNLVIELGTSPSPDRLRYLLGQALHDPSVELAYWLPAKHTFVDIYGKPMELPANGSGRAATELLGSHNEPLAVLLHDASLEDQPRLVRSVAAAARLSLENEHLQAEIRAHLEEVRASRTRIVEASDAERRRLERNLHDGAQQHLVALSLALSVARAQKWTDANPELETSLAEAAKLLDCALSDLRDLARGLHPKILTDKGLSPALESLAERSIIPAVVTATFPTRLPILVEATAYFIVAEALANVTKYAEASAVTVYAAHINGKLVVEVVDDGVGGADATKGTGLHGLLDRVATLDGCLQVESVPGRGTRVSAQIPCA